MKAGLLAIAALAASASAAVHRGPRHAHAHPKRDANGNVVVETAVQYVTATAPNVVVYVDNNGNPVSTAAQGAAATAAPAAEPAKEKAPAPKPYTQEAAKPKPKPKPNTQAAAAPAPAYSAPSSSAPSNQGSSGGQSTSGSNAGAGSSGGSGRSISYAPYNDDGSCKSQDQVNSDFQKFDGYGMVRIYGTDCNQVETVLSAAKAKNMKVFAGIFDITQVASEAQTIIDAAKNDWDCIDTVSVGNELVNAGTASVGQVTAAIGTARGLLKGAGYNGHVVTVDTFTAMIANPGLCQASDYAAANCHAFFDSSVEASGAGAFVAEQKQRVSDACGGKRTVITETGWPWKGDSNGAAVPSRSNQQAALDSIKSKLSSDVILFSAFDDGWKQNFDGSYGCEQFWGFLE